MELATYEIGSCKCLLDRGNLLHCRHFQNARKGNKTENECKKNKEQGEGVRQLKERGCSGLFAGPFCVPYHIWGYKVPS